MKLSTLQDLYNEQLRDIYDAEQQIVKTLPQLAKAASTEELKNAFEEHLEQSKEQVSRLEQIFENSGGSPKGQKCRSMVGIIDECKEMLAADAEPEVLDAALIACAQRIEHYEMAVYGCLCSFAKVLGRDEDAELLQQTLDEEKEADEALTDLAESSVNAAAHKEQGTGEEEAEETSGKAAGKKASARSR